jgi:hypothetical protein
MQALAIAYNDQGLANYNDALDFASRTSIPQPKMPTDWSRLEVEATVADHFAMLAKELSGVPYNKTAHRRQLSTLLENRSEQSIEFKHANISAVLIELGFQYIAGYKPRSNYQRLLYDVIAERLPSNSQLLNIAAADADQPVALPEVDDILSILTDPPAPSEPRRTRESPPAPCIFGELPRKGGAKSLAW